MDPGFETALMRFLLRLWYMCTKLHDVIYQTKVMFMFTAVRSSDLVRNINFTGWFEHDLESCHLTNKKIADISLLCCKIHAFIFATLLS